MNVRPPDCNGLRHFLHYIGLFAGMCVLMGISTKIGNAQVQSFSKLSSTQGNFGGGLSNGDQFGHGLTSIGDLDGDGVVDLAVGAWLNDQGGSNKGTVWILFMNSNGTVRSKTQIAENVGGFSGNLDNDDYFGIAVASVGDLNGDGNEELAVGAAGDDDGGGSNGAVWILFLNDSGQVTSQQKISDTAGNFSAPLAGSLFGIALSPIGDLDGDSVPDLVVGGAFDEEIVGLETGAVWVLFLNANGTVKSHQKINESQGSFDGNLSDDDEFGRSVTYLGDVDGDGITDMAVGSRNDGGAGAVWVLMMNANGTVKTEAKIGEFQGNFGNLDAGDRFGRSVAPLGDINSDGVPDLAVGADGDDDGGGERGAVWILNLNRSGTVASSAKISDTSGGFTGDLDDLDLFGIAVHANGDIDNDGFVDLLVGASRDGDGGSDRGAVWWLNTSYTNNTPPQVISIPNLTALEDPQTNPFYDLDVYFSDAQQSASSLVYTYTVNSNSGLFDSVSLPGGSERITFDLAENQNGTAQITVRATDTGGLFVEQTFFVNVTPVNDEPSFTSGGNQTVDEDTGAQSTGWAGNISPGPADEGGQSVSFEVTNNNQSLFATQPSIDTNGTLAYEPAQDMFGSATVTVVARDNGGTQNGGDDESQATSFTIQVNAVNDAPRFTKGADQLVGASEGEVEVIEWATSISAGPANEAGQTLTFLVETDAPSLFSVAPSMDANGTLRFTPDAETSGTTGVSVRLQDSGGVANGGVDTSEPQEFQITIESEPQAPVFEGDPDTTAIVGSAYTSTVRAVGIPAPRYFLEPPSPGTMAIDSISGLIQWTPAETDTPSVSVRVRASNSAGDAFLSYDINVSPVPTAPVITSTPESNAVVNTEYEYIITAEGYPKPTFAIVSPPSPASATVDSVEGKLLWTPTQAGTTVTIEVAAKNSVDTVTQSFEVEVESVPEPDITCGNAESINTRAATLVASVNGFGVDTNILFEYGIEGTTDTLKVSGNPGMVSSPTALPVQARIKNLTPATDYEFKAVAINDAGLSDTCSNSFRTPNYPSQVFVQAEVNFGDHTLEQSYRMVSVPGDVKIDIASSFTGNTGEDWNAFRDDGSPSAGSDDKNYLIPYRNIADFEFWPGRGFWVLGKEAWRIEGSEQPSVELDSEGAFGISLERGWNIIGNPFDQTIAWSDVLAANPAIPVNHPIYEYNGSGMVLPVAQFLAEYKGYYFENSFVDESNNTIVLDTLRIPYIIRSGKTHLETGFGLSWPALFMSVREGENIHATARIDILPDAKRGKDRFDHHVSRNVFSDTRLQLQPEGMYAKPLQIEARPPIQDSDVFRIEIDREEDTPFYLDIAGIEDFTQWAIYLVDLETARRIDVHASSSTLMTGFKGTKKFDLVIGKPDIAEASLEEYIPEHIVLSGAFPNPFEHSTTISFTLPSVKPVSLRVYDMLGRRIQTLTEGVLDAGTYEVGWSGQNEAGVLMASGAYLYVLEAGDKRLVKKMVFLR